MINLVDVGCFPRAILIREQNLKGGLEVLRADFGV